MRGKQAFMATAMVACALLTAGQRAGAEAPVAPADWSSGLRWVQPARFQPARLDGKPVIVEFWTFGCINCRRTIPAMRELETRFGRDIPIVGIHTPEFDWEKQPEAVRRTVRREGIRYAVAQDNDYRAWNAFGNHYWPALYVLDRNGRIRYTHAGELHQGTPSWSELVALLEGLRTEGKPRS